MGETQFNKPENSNDFQIRGKVVLTDYCIAKKGFENFRPKQHLALYEASDDQCQAGDKRNLWQYDEQSKQIKNHDSTYCWLRRPFQIRSNNYHRRFAIVTSRCADQSQSHYSLQQFDWADNGALSPSDFPNEIVQMDTFFGQLTTVRATSNRVITSLGGIN